MIKLLVFLSLKQGHISYMKMKSFFKSASFIFYLQWILTNSVIGHEDLTHQIEHASELIQTNSAEAELYFQRAELYRLNENPDAAMTDYEKAIQLNPDLDAVFLGKAELYYQIGWMKSAGELAKHFLNSNPHHVKANILLARVLNKQGDYLSSYNQYSWAIEMSNEPEPHYYIERAEVLLLQDFSKLDEALSGIDEALRTIGPAITLRLFAIDLLVKKQNYADALTRMDEIIAGSPRKDAWLVKKAEILEIANQPQEASHVYREALKEIQSLPEDKQKTTMTTDLKEKIESALKRLEGSLSDKLTS